jgi:hypothetical protein
VCLYPNGGDPMMTEPDLVTIGINISIDEDILLLFIYAYILVYLYMYIHVYIKKKCLFPNAGDPMMTEPDLVIINR